MGRGDSECSHDKVWEDATVLEGTGSGLEAPADLRDADKHVVRTKLLDGEAVTAAATGEGNGKNRGKYLKGMKELSFKEVTRLPTQLKCLYTNAHSLGNKQEELVMLAVG